MSVQSDGAGVRTEFTFGVFGGDSALDGDSTWLNVFLFEVDFFEGGSAGDADLGLDDVDAGDFFGDGVFHLCCVWGVRERSGMET